MAQDGDGLSLKEISASAVPQAIEKAEQYRLLNEPSLAESICLDVFSAAPSDQKNLKVLILAITDQCGSGKAHSSREDLMRFVSMLESEYERCYYTGIIAEREARASLARTYGAEHAYVGLHEAMTWFEKADSMSPPSNNDARLRYNTCVRTIRSERLEPPSPVSELPLE